MNFMGDDYRPIHLDRRTHSRRTVPNASTQAAALRGRGSDRPVGTFLARILDLSDRGMRIHADSALEAGRSYWFRLDLPGRGPSLRVRGEVAWTREPDAGEAGFRAGIAFLSLSAERTADLRSALAELP